MKPSNIFSALILFFTVLSLPAPAQCPKGEKPYVKNVIYMIGDGMGIAHVTALMLEGEKEKVHFERAHAVGFVKTHSANNRVTDSGAAGTALATGTKTNNSMLGVDPDLNPRTSILMKAKKEGYATGIVVSSRITHATPAAFYANIKSRSNEDSIAIQFLEKDIDVAFGGGKRHFTKRKDERNLLPELEKKGYTVYQDFNDLANVSTGKTIGLFASSHLPTLDKGRGDYLPMAVSKALEILSNDSADDKGFFLMVEGSLIDYASHAHDTDLIIKEMDDFDNAIGIAFDFADAHPGTLVVVLADHETAGMSIPSVKADFLLAESGLRYNYGTTGHSGVMIPMFAYGTGTEYFSRIFDNTDIPKIIECLQLGNCPCCGE